MTLRLATLAAAGALLCAGAAFAQSGGGSGPAPQGYYQQMPAKPAAGRRHHGVVGIIREEVRAGRLSQKEGTLIAQKIRQLHKEKRAERQARLNGQGTPPQQQPR